MLRAALTSLLAVLALQACAEAQRRPAANPGVCWRLEAGVERVVERNVPNPETCAARLEVLRQQSGADLEGRYQTVRLFVSAAAIEAVMTGGGPRTPLFEPAALAELREATRRRIAAESAPRRTGPPVMPGESIDAAP